MCYFVSSKLTNSDIKKVFNAEYQGPDYKGSTFINGFAFPQLPVITDEKPHIAVLGDWGLVPPWSRDENIRKMTLNARAETITEKPAFKASVSQRCLILVNGFYEWKWLDPAGKKKQRYYIELNNDHQPFAIAGIYNRWQNSETGQDLLSFSLLTTKANELMAEIHNTKHRMPLALAPSVHKSWLAGKSEELFTFPHYNTELIATEA